MPTLGQLGRAKSGLSSDALSELLRQREQAQASGQAEPGLRDIYQYVSNQGAGSFFISPNEQNGGESGMGSSATVPWQTISHGAGDNAWTEQMPGVDPRFAGVVRFASNAGHSNEGSGSWRAEVDGSKLPTTRFGDVTRTAPVNAHTPLFNPALVYDDPQYGRITDARNVRPDKLNQMVGMMLPSLAMGGIGLLGAPALGTQLVGLARALGNGGNTTVGTGVNLATSQGGLGGASIATLGTGRNGGAGGTQLFPATTSAANGGTTGAAPGFSIPGYDSHSDGAGGGAGGNASAVAAITGGGCPGFIRAASAVNGGDGAGSDEGYGGQGGATNTNGNGATTPGSGGGGGGRRTSGTVFSGKGADGSVIYIEYLSA